MSILVNEFGVPLDGVKVRDRGKSSLYGEGVVDSVTEDKVRVYFYQKSNWINHLLDGKDSHFHFEPTLRLVERPKKKVTKTVTFWVNMYHHGLAYQCYDSKELADSGQLKNRIRCVEVTGTYEEEK